MAEIDLRVQTLPLLGILAARRCLRSPTRAAGGDVRSLPERVYLPLVRAAYSSAYSSTQWSANVSKAANSASANG
jgi:hypothetical protein